MSLPRISPSLFRRLAFLAAVLLGLLVVTGGAVRLTGSGLGCPDWPRCTASSYVAPASYHALVEFVNRVVTFAVGVFIAAVAVASWLRRPRRRDLMWLSGSLVAGFLAQAVVGGLSVLYHLTPPWVMAHFLLSMVMLAAAIVLTRRAHPAYRPSPPVVRRELVVLADVVVAAAAVVLVLGTVTTGTGPHAGSGGHIQRLPFPLERVTQLHADAALFLTGLVVATLFAVRLTPVPALVRRRAHLVAAAIAAQVAIGYAQYFLDLPAGLVEVHIAGATLLWAAVVGLRLAVTTADTPAGPPVSPQHTSVTGGAPVTAFDPVRRLSSPASH